MDQLRSVSLTKGAGPGQCDTFTPTPGDVFICTPPKCGTTLVQQMVHSLRTGGDMSFEEISLVIPFMELHHAFGYEDLDAPQPGCLRAFKTHRSQPGCPGGFRDDCKYIYIIRDPEDAATSFFRFFDGWVFPHGSVTVDEFVHAMYLAAGQPDGKHEKPPTWWHHLISWYPFRSKPNMLFLFYEDIIQVAANSRKETEWRVVQHKQKSVELLADFLGIPLEEGLLEVVLRQSSKQAMTANPSKYDNHPLKLRVNGPNGLPPDAGLGNGKVRSAPKAVLSQDTVAALRQRWVDLLEPVTGCRTYGSFRSHTNAELRRPF